MSAPGHPASLPEIDPVDANAHGGDDVLLDVRELDEWAVGHAPGAHHLPLSRLHPDELPAGRLLVICRSGGRSSRAVAALRNAGFDAVNVTGGMQGWAAAGLPVVRDDGRPGAVA
jgi:rhodanese-related sulfurtransferase